MTGNQYLDLAISFAGIALLTLISYLLGGWRTVKITQSAAADRLAFDEPDFAPTAWLIGEDGKAAAALSSAGDEIAIVFPLGDGLVSRRLKADALACVRNNAALEIRLNEPSKRSVTLMAPSTDHAVEWARQLGCS